MKAVPILLLVSIFSGCAPDEPGADKAHLVQNYVISATKNETKVQATVSLLDRYLRVVKKRAPLSIELNGNKLKPASLPAWAAPTFQIAETGLQIVPSDITQPTAAGYAATIDSFSKVATFTVVIDEADQRESSIAFSPVEVAGGPEMRLSRSRSNEISFVGGERVRDKKLSVGFLGSGNLFDDKQVRVDWSKRLIVLPPESLRRMPLGPATLFVISSDTGFLHDQYESDTESVSKMSSYIFTFSDGVRVIITD